MSTSVNKALGSAKTVTQGFGFSFPDDLVVHILSSLPAEDVLRCWSVCRRWRDLTSTQIFVHTHSRRSALMFVGMAVTINHEFKRFLFSRWWEPLPTKSMICILNKFPKGVGRNPRQCSGDGLLISKCYKSTEFTIFNPVDGKEVTISMPRKMFWGTGPLAIYFHPTLKEYCVLWEIHWPLEYYPDEEGIQCMILNLGSKPCWRKIRNPWIHLFKYPYKSTVSVDRYLYWLVKPPDVEGDDEDSVNFAIMEFDILLEESKVLLSPVPTTVKYHGYYDINLVDVGGLLSLFLISPTENRIYQWTLISREETLWTSCIHNITEGWQFDKLDNKPVALVEEHLLVMSSGLFLVVNLKLGTIRKLRMKLICPYIKLEHHVISLASLRNCKSKIIIEEKDDEIIGDGFVMSRIQKFDQQAE